MNRRAMTTNEIRERFLRFFEARGHRRIPSASLVPSAHDPSALLTVAGMHPLKPYFLGAEAPPARRLTSCQKCFRTVDIDNVGNTNRHLTFFEMLGNFSIGDYFKRDAIQFALELSVSVLDFDEHDIWVTVFAGDQQLGLGPDREAIELWQAQGVPRERIVECPRAENFWQAGPTGPSGPSSELYLDRGVEFGEEGDLPGGENERFLEYWNLVFMQYNQEPPNVLEELPTRNIDTGLGLERLAALLQDKRSVFETDQLAPLIELGEQLSGRRYGGDFTTDRALRILADHSRAMTFLLADGVVPSNEDRGYVLRRVMRRAIVQGRRLELEHGYLARYAERVRELMGPTYPELDEQREAIERWLESEEDGFGRTLEQGLAVLRVLIERARDAGRDSVAADDAFKLHDTSGFPIDLTKELLAEEGLRVDEQGFERLMGEQRARARAAAGGRAAVGGRGAGGGRDAAAAARRGEHGSELAERVREFAEAAGARTRFTGYEREEQRTSVRALEPRDGRWLVKLAESPFYPVGGGQVSDVGVIECAGQGCRARVEEVFRVGDDQALAVVLEQGTLDPDEPVLARVDHPSRHATECNHTATHLLHAALRLELGGHVRQAGSYAGPDKLRFDFTHGGALSAQQLRAVEDRVNEWIARNDPVRPITTTLEEARRLGAMALFGEKYGEVVRMVEIGDGEHSRELCGGTHVRTTAEIALFHIASESSSAANVRRIEALTGPAGVALLRERARLLDDVAHALRTRPEEAPEAVRAREQERRRLEKALRSGALANGSAGRLDPAELVAAAQRIDGVAVVAAKVSVPDPRALLEAVDRVKGRLGEDGVIVLGAAIEDRASLAVSVAPSLVPRGLRAGELVKVAAAVVGGGGGGRDTLAQAGGRDAGKLEEAIAAARGAISSALGA